MSNITCHIQGCLQSTMSKAESHSKDKKRQIHNSSSYKSRLQLHEIWNRMIMMAQNYSMQGIRSLQHASSRINLHKNICCCIHQDSQIHFVYGFDLGQNNKPKHQQQHPWSIARWGQSMVCSEGILCSCKIIHLSVCLSEVVCFTQFDTNLNKDPESLCFVL